MAAKNSKKPKLISRYVSAVKSQYLVRFLCKCDGLFVVTSSRGLYVFSDYLVARAWYKIEVRRCRGE
jgi:hypothetical protein